MVEDRWQTSDASCCPLSAVGLPLSVSVLDRIPENGRGARLRRRGDSPALPRGLRVVFASLRGRMGKTVFLKAKGFRRLRRPGSIGHVLTH